MLRERDVLGNLSLREDLEADLDGDLGHFAARIQVQVEVDLRPRLDQAARVRREDIAVLPQRVLVQEQADRILFRILDEVGREVVDHLEALRVHRLALDRHHVHVFCESGIDQHVNDVVRTRLREDIRFVHLDDDVGLADEPRQIVGERARSRQVRRVAHRRAVVHPFGDRLHLAVGQRRIVLELGDAHVAIDVPRRHLAIDDLRANRARPRPGLLIGHQRHRRDGAEPVTRLAVLLENWRHILRESDLRGLCAAGGRKQQHRADGRRAQLPSRLHHDLQKMFG